MFYKIEDVNFAFFRIFLDWCSMKTVEGIKGEMPLFPLMVNNTEEVDVSVRYFNRTGEGGIEDARGKYPCLVIQDFIPMVDRSYQYGKSWVEGNLKQNGKKEIKYLPIRFLCKYQINILSNRKREQEALLHKMLQVFDYNLGEVTQISLNKQVINGEETEDVVNYSTEISETIRPDGRFENIFTVTLRPFIYIKPDGEGDVIEKIKILVKNKNDIEYLLKDLTI